MRAVLTNLGFTGPGQPVHDEELSSMYAVYARERRAYYVVALDGAEPRILGGAGIAPLREGPSDTCELRKMYLLPAARGLGAGRDLLAACLEAARANGYGRSSFGTTSVYGT